MENNSRIYQQALDVFLDERPDLIHVEEACLLPGNAPLWVATGEDLNTAGDPLETRYILAKGKTYLDLSREEYQVLQANLSRPDQLPRLKFQEWVKAGKPEEKSERLHLIDETHHLIKRFDFYSELNKLSDEALYEIGTVLLRHVKSLEDEETDEEE